MAHKTVMIVRNASKNDFGGGERYPVYLSLELKNKKFKPVVYSHHNKIISLCEENDIPAHKMPWLSLQNYSGFRNILIPLYFLWMAVLIAWYLVAIKKTGSDIVHLQSRDDFIAGTIAGRILKKSVVWTDHADLKYIYQNTSLPFKNIVGKIVKLVSKNAKAILVVSKNELSLIEKALGSKTPNNYTVVYNGISDQQIAKYRAYDENTVLFVATSRLVRSKGIYELIEATKKLANNNYPVKSLILGEGKDKANMLDYADESIIFLGFPNNYMEVVNGADFFIHPSYNEGFSLSILEAAMLGKPVITTKVGGNPEIIEDGVTGLLVKPKSVHELYIAMEYSINNRAAMNRMGRELRKKYLAKFQFNNIVSEKIITIYEGKK